LNYCINSLTGSTIILDYREEVIPLTATESGTVPVLDEFRLIFIHETGILKNPESAPKSREF